MGLRFFVTAPRGNKCFLRYLYYCLKSVCWPWSMRGYDHPISQGSLTVATVESNIWVTTQNEGIVLIHSVVQLDDEWKAFYKAIQDPRLLPWCGLPSSSVSESSTPSSASGLVTEKSKNMGKVQLFSTALAKMWDVWPSLTFHWQELVTWPRLDTRGSGNVV